MQDRVYFCILSDQTLQNVLPLNSYPANLICLMASDKMVAEKKHIKFTQLLLDLDYIKETSQVVTFTMPSHDFAKISEWATEQINEIYQSIPKARIIFNATGGTKLMSLALVQAFQKPELAENIEIIYCDTTNDTLEIIYPIAYQTPLQPDILNAEDILKAHNIRINSALSDRESWQEQVQQRAELSQYLGQNMHDKLGSFIGALNGEIARKLNGREIEGLVLPLTLELGSKVSANWRYVLELMADLKLITFSQPLNQSSSARFDVHNHDVIRYLHGVWLEEYLWLCFNEAKVSDVASGVEISSLHEGQEVKDNELDIIAAHRNNLIIVECKTANIARQQMMNLALDKLADLSRRGGGLFAERWFAMARWPFNEPEIAERFRHQAKERNVVLIEPEHLADLTNRLKIWKKTSKFPLELA